MAPVGFMLHAGAVGGAEWGGSLTIFLGRGWEIDRTHPKSLVCTGDIHEYPWCFVDDSGGRMSPVSLCVLSMTQREMFLCASWYRSCCSSLREGNLSSSQWFSGEVVCTKTVSRACWIYNLIARRFYIYIYTYMCVCVYIYIYSRWQEFKSWRDSNPHCT